MPNRLKKLLTRLFPCFSLVIPKKKQLWLFGAWQGKLYADNSKVMFEYINMFHPEIEAVWISRSDSVVEQVRQLGYKSYKRTSLKGIWASLRASMAFETEGEQDISYLLNNKRTKVIQLWHGMGSKSMKWKSANGKITIDDKKNRDRLSSYHWISTSELYTKTISDLLGVPEERFVITGYPRNDNLLAAPYNENMESLRKKYSDCRFMIYMPTHRNFGADGNKLINLTELKRVDSLLKEKNIVMVYKPHIHELKNFLSYASEFSNIIMAKEQELWADVYSYLHYFDLLISDYSSVITDFMCTGKPVILFPYDIEDYINGDAGLNDYFWEIPGGPMCYTWDEVVETCASLLTNDNWKEERERCRAQYHYYNDGKNCERVYIMVMDIIENKK